MELVAVEFEELAIAAKDQSFASSLTQHEIGFGIQQRPGQTTKLPMLRRDSFENYLFLILFVSLKQYFLINLFAGYPFCWHQPKFWNALYLI